MYDHLWPVKHSEKVKNYGKIVFSCFFEYLLKFKLKTFYSMFLGIFSKILLLYCVTGSDLSQFNQFWDFFIK